MNFTIINLGCKVNRIESDDANAALRSRGWCETEAESADIIIINSCTVTGDAEKKTRKAVRRALRQTDKIPVMVTGCSVAINQQEYLKLDERVVVELDKSKLAERAVELVANDELVEADNCGGSKTPAELAGQAIIAGTYPQGDGGQERIRFGKGFRSRVGIKIQDGCRNSCSFCIVHTARGEAKSRSFNEIIQEVRSHEVQGCREFVLSGINLGSYQDTGRDLVTLLKELLRTSEKARFRISSIEPCDVSKRLIELIADSEGRVCRHLHLPLQSGSSKVLKEMNRPYDVPYYSELVRSLYHAIPSLSLSTDLIVGFPGESNLEFEESLALMEECRFSKVHVFPYSARIGTPAALRDDQVNAESKAERVTRARACAEALRKQDFLRRKGTQEFVLVESQGRATTESYHQIEVSQSEPIGKLLQIVI